MATAKIKKVVLPKKSNQKLVMPKKLSKLGEFILSGKSYGTIIDRKAVMK